LTELIHQRLVKTGHVPQRYADLMDTFFKLQKKIVHREIQELTGKQFDEYKKQAQDFVKVMQKVVEQR
jgi:SOS-response transcriptional repressor LexA